MNRQVYIFDITYFSFNLNKSCLDVQFDFNGLKVMILMSTTKNSQDIQKDRETKNIQLYLIALQFKHRSTVDELKDFESKNAFM